MKKSVSFVLILALCAGQACFAAGKSAAEIRREALQKDTVQSSVQYLVSMAGSAATNADRRSLLYFTGKLQESLGLYADASRSYASAAGIAAGDAEGMPKVSSEQLVLCAVRASLCAGEFDTADSYLNSAVRSSKDATVLAMVNMYSVWSQLCRAQDVAQTKDAVSLLSAYKDMESMRSVRAMVLFTLWYLTDDAQYASALKSDYPKSPEYAIVTGSASVVSVPFWYFVPRAEHNLADESSVADRTVSVVAETASSSGTKRRQQVGFFASKANADSLVARLKDKGFSAYYFTETRASGTTYYTVVVDENSDGTMGLKLKDAGFECYLLAE